MEKTKKKSTGKKILKWSFIVFASLLILLFVAPFVFKGKIEKIITNTINKNINATVTFTDTNLSFFRHFPLASVSINNIVLANKAPFVGDTLFKAERVSLDMNITELFKSSSEPMKLKSVATENGAIIIIVNKDNIGNYDIALKDSTSTTTESNSSLQLDIESYNLQNMQFHYIDAISKINFALDSIIHSGNGNFNATILDLNTNTTAQLSLAMDNVNYFNKVHIDLDAILGIDLENSKYTFKENTAHINQLPLQFDGFIQLVEKGQRYDLNFKTPTSSFKNALALMPEQYSGNLNAIKTSGNFDMNGTVKGTLSENTIPAFNILLNSKNAMFKYDELPKAVTNINLNTAVTNKTGNLKDTYINVNTFNFKIDNDAFALKADIANLLDNPKVNLTANGTINLENIGKVYPAPVQDNLAGILNANISTAFDMNSIEKGIYKNIKNSGKVAVSNFKYESKEMANTFYINKTAIIFNTNTIKLDEFKAKTGTSDVNVTGNLNNLYGFLFKDENLKGNFNLNSNNFKVDDFLMTTQDTLTTETTTASVKIPAFLDVQLKAKAKNVIYDDLNLTNVSGNLIIKDQTVTLQNIQSDIFNGKIAFNGKVSTKEATPNFNMNLDLKKIGISESLSKLSMLSAIAPIAGTLEGKLNTKINVSGNLTKQMTPNLQSISGDLFGQLLQTKINSEKSNVLSLVGNKVDFLDVSKLDLNEASALFSFNNGKVNVKPFKITYKDIQMNISGEHSFNNLMDYNITFDVPVKYLGSSVTSALAKLTPSDAASIKTVPVNATLNGSFGAPNFSSNIANATSDLMKNIVEKQKQSLVNKGKDKLTNLLTENNTKDSTKTNSTEDKIKGAIKGLFGKKKNN